MHARPLCSILFAAVFAGCTSTPSSADQVNRSGSWQVSFVRLVDLSESPYVETAPAPEYPARVMRAPHSDAASCTPGCECGFVSASEDCYGDVGQTCHALGGFVETCAAQQTRLDCSNVTFESDDGTTGVCVLEDLSAMDEFGYRQIRRYEVTLDRLSYD
jgi:hypothetical protein